MNAYVLIQPAEGGSNRGQLQSLRKVQCQSLTMPQSLCFILHWVLCPQGSDLPVTGPTMNYFPGEYSKVLCYIFWYSDLVYNILCLPFIEVCLLWNYGERDISVLGTTFDGYVPELTQQKLTLGKKVKFRMCVQLWVVAWLIVLPLICDPFLGAVTNSIAIISGPKENCEKKIPLVHQLGNAQYETNMYPHKLHRKEQPFLFC